MYAVCIELFSDFLSAILLLFFLPSSIILSSTNTGLSTALSLKFHIERERFLSHGVSGTRGETAFSCVCFGRCLFLVQTSCAFYIQALSARFLSKGMH